MGLEIQISEWLSANVGRIIYTVAIALLYLIFNYFYQPKLEAKVENTNLKSASLSRARISLNIVFSIIGVILLLLIWGFELQGLIYVAASILAVVGVALFAQWSILSNVTSFFILLYQRPYKRGNFIRVISGDNYFEGYISEIGMFNTKLLTENREAIVFPNNQMVMTPAVINSKRRFNDIGKSTEFGACLETRHIAFKNKCSKTQRRAPGHIAYDGY